MSRLETAKAITQVAVDSKNWMCLPLKTSWTCPLIVSKRASMGLPYMGLDSVDEEVQFAFSLCSSHSLNAMVASRDQLIQDWSQSKFSQDLLGSSGTVNTLIQW